MPTKIEKDAISGTETTGHEWDGIKELNTPMPRWWLYVLYATIVFSVVYWVLFPSIPGLSGYVKGVLGYDSRSALETQMEKAQARQAVYWDRVAALEVADVAGDIELFNFAFAGGRAAFADNCAPCHGLGGAGQDIYPSLADDDWLWGGALEEIQTTIRYGVRADHEETRLSEMPAFGADELLEPDQIGDVAEFVLSLSGAGDDAAAAARGAGIFEENCAACHGEGGEGDIEQGAPRLNDQIWLYGGTKGQIAAQINRPKHGSMPAWSGRLDESTIKLLAVYVHALGGGQ